MRPKRFQPSTVEKAKKNRHTATNILPKVSPNTVPKAAWARLVLLSAVLAAAAPHSWRGPPEVYRVEIMTKAFRVSTTKVSMNTPAIATTPWSWG